MGTAGVSEIFWGVTGEFKLAGMAGGVRKWFSWTLKNNRRIIKDVPRRERRIRKRKNVFFIMHFQYNLKSPK